jgi:hypothetical protein
MVIITKSNLMTWGLLLSLHRLEIYLLRDILPFAQVAELAAVYVPRLSHLITEAQWPGSVHSMFPSLESIFLGQTSCRTFIHSSSSNHVLCQILENHINLFLKCKQPSLILNSNLFVITSPIFLDLMPHILCKSWEGGEFLVFRKWKLS